MAKVMVMLCEKNDEFGSTWVTSFPVNSTDAWSIWKAVDLAAENFKMSVARDAVAVKKALSEAG